MKKIIKSIFLLLITAYILYIVNDKYNLTKWVVEMNTSERYDDPNEFVKRVRLAMLEGTDHIVLTYTGKIDNLDWFTDTAMKLVYKIDDPDTSSDYDFLRYNTKSIESHITGIGNIMSVTYDFTYNESAQETEEVDKKINQLLKKWNMDKLSDYEKVKKIHDYIIQNAAYDASLTNYSAYDNLINKSSTCQGYMSLAYKMLTEANIPCRVISGTGNGQSHGWNIVRLKGKWYNLDCTWDDPLTWNGKETLIYDYFLKSEKDFKGHVRDAEYQTKKFYQKYEMGEKSYR
jgi:hypothetical protein